MPTEQRVISSRAGAIPGRPDPAGAAVAGAPGAEAAAAKPKKKLFMIIGVLVVLGAGAYWFLLGPGADQATGGSGADAVKEVTYEAGKVYTVEPVSLNLAGGHYLRLGMGLQLTTDVAYDPDPAKALDLAIGLFSGRTVEEVQSPEGREALRAELTALLTEAYPGKVMGVYFTDYVTQ